MAPRAMQASPCYPLLCEPLFKPKIWGGRGLERILDKRLPPGELIGESWEVADVPEGTSGIANGPLTGMSLRQAMEQYGEALVPAPQNPRFPLLVKFIDAQDDLSVQVHPGRDACERHFPEERSKEECWIVVHSAPGGCILHGVQPGVTWSEVAARMSDGRVVECMRRVPVQAGDVVRLPPGTIHALLKGVMVLEIQEPSDSTFRVHDYGRLGEDGRPRPLHIERALKALRLREDAPAKLASRRQIFAWGHHESLMDIAPYRIERLSLQRPVVCEAPSAVSIVLVVLAGRVLVRQGDDATALRLGDTCILPAAVDRAELHPEGDTQIILATPGPGPKEAGAGPAVRIEGL